MPHVTGVGGCHGGNEEWVCGGNARATDGKLIRFWHLDRHRPPSWYAVRRSLHRKTDNASSLSGKSECPDREESPTFTTLIRGPRSGKLLTVSLASKSRSFLELNTSPGLQLLGPATS